MIDKKSILALGMRSLRCFIAVAEELHFGRAAQRLALAQPAVSLQIRALEERLGVRLFDRRGREVTLTAAGDVLLGHARRLLASAGAAVEETRRAARGVGGHLTVGFVHSLSYVAVPPILSRFRAAFPDVALTLQELPVSQLRDAILSEEIDVGIVRPPVRHPAVRTAMLWSETFVAALPVSHRLARRVRIRATDLAGEPLVMFPETAGDMGVQGQLIRWFAEHRVTPRIVQEVRTLHTCIGVIRAGFGVAVVPSSARLMRLDGVTYVNIVGAPSLATMIACRQTNSAPLVQSFCQLAQTVAAPS